MNQKRPPKETHRLSRHAFPFSSAPRCDACVKRDVYISKETYIHQMRPTNMKKDKKHIKRNPKQRHQKWPLKETYRLSRHICCTCICPKRPVDKRELQKRPTHLHSLGMCVAVCCRVSCLFFGTEEQRMCQKRPIYVKRDPRTRTL